MDSKIEQLHSQARSLVAKFEQRGGTNNIDEAIALDREALAICPSGHSERSFALTLLAIHLGDRYNQLGGMMDVEEAITLDREALELRPPGHPDRSASLINLALHLSIRYNRLGNMEDLDEAIVLDQEALAVCPSGSSDLSKCLNNLAAHLSARYSRFGEMEDLDKAIAFCRDALALRPPGHPDRSMSLSNLAADLYNRYMQLGTIEDLNEVIDLDRDALVLCPPGHPHRSASLNNLAVRLCTRYEQLGRIDDLNEAILLDREALPLRPPGHPDRAMSLNNLATDLSNRYKQLGSMEDLNEAIILNRDSLMLRPPGHPLRSASLNNLAHHLCTRYEQLGDIGDLNEAILLDRESLELHPSGHPHRPASLNNLAFHLSTRYEQLGAIDDLNEAIFLDREALALRPPGHVDRSTSLNNLAVDVSARYQQLGMMEDLNEAIDLHRAALTLHSLGHPHRAMSLNNLASRLSTRYENFGVMEDLNEAIILDGEALALRPPGNPNRSISLNNLSVRLCTRYKQLGEMQDLSMAIVLDREALALRPPGHPDRSTSLSNLASHLSTRYEQLMVIDDLHEAILLDRDALASRPPGHPHRSTSLNNLAVDLSTLYKQLGKAADHDELFGLYTELVHVQESVSAADLFAAHAWVNAAENYHHPTTVLAYETSLRLMIQHLTTLPTLPRNLGVLKYLTSSLALDAFSSCLRFRSATKAVELLEQGRGVFWSQLSRLRSPLEDVVACGPEGKMLSERFARLTSLIRNVLDSPGEDQHDRVWHLNIELQSVVNDIRALPGLSHFLSPSLFSDLRQAAREGPVIIVNASKYSCDALVVHIDRDPVHIPLLIIQERVRQLSSNLRSLTARAKSMNMAREFVVLLRELWDDVVSPIVDVLRTKYPRRSRIWWCPTAEFSLLPLHAAGQYRKGQLNLGDLYISSYTPTLTALIRARRHAPSHSGDKTINFVAIGQANATGQSGLLSVGDELTNIGQRVKALTTFTRIEGSESCISRVADELGKNKWVHLACHGLPNRKQPFESAFALHDGHFTIERIMRCELENPEFAYLSACHTTVGDEESPDEVIHLASAMQFAGFRSVIGTMWAVDDGETNKITSLFYDNMVDESGQLDHTRAALALHKTMRRLVDVPFDQRILYIHLGA